MGEGGRLRQKGLNSIEKKIMRNILKIISRLLTPPSGGVGEGVALIRADKLFSTIYIAGTAVAIASAMVVAIVLNIILADIAPEVNRSRTLYAEGYIMTDSTRDAGAPILPGFSEDAIDSCFKKMQCVEAAAGVTHYRHNICNEKMENKVYQMIVGCDTELYRLYDFTFIEGRPF